MPLVIDQMNREILLPEFPKRIISLVPSQTELLYYFGLSEEVVGQTLFCIHPKEMHKTKPRVGGTKKLNIEKIESLMPDLIIGNKEENDQGQIEYLMNKFPVWMSDITTMNDAYQMIDSIGNIIGKKAQAELLLTKIKLNFEKIDCLIKRPAVYLIWQKPWMAAGSDTFISSMMDCLGYQNLVKGRYDEFTLEDLAELNPEVILLSSEPFPFKEKHQLELQKLLINIEIKLVDGEIFSWYGSRMLLAKNI